MSDSGVHEADKAVWKRKLQIIVQTSKPTLDAIEKAAQFWHNEYSVHVENADHDLVPHDFIRILEQCGQHLDKIGQGAEAQIKKLDTAFGA
jgi:hypothetical protein